MYIHTTQFKYMLQINQENIYFVSLWWLAILDDDDDAMNLYR